MRFGSRRTLQGSPYPTYEQNRFLYLPLVGPFSNLSAQRIDQLEDITITTTQESAASTRTNPLKYKTITLQPSAQWEPPNLSDMWIWCDHIIFQALGAEIRAEADTSSNTGNGDSGGSGGGAGGHTSGSSGTQGATNGASASNSGSNVGGTGMGSLSSPFTLPQGGAGGQGDSSGPNIGSLGGNPGPGRGGGGGGSAYDISGPGSGGGGAAGGKFLCIVANRITGSGGIVRARGLLGHFGFSGGVARGGRGGGGAILVLSREYNSVISTQSVNGASNGNAVIYSIGTSDGTTSQTFASTWDNYP